MALLPTSSLPPLGTQLFVNCFLQLLLEPWLFFAGSKEKVILTASPWFINATASPRASAFVDIALLSSKVLWWGDSSSLKSGTTVGSTGETFKIGA